MKAIISENKTYKVTGTRGVFTICEDSKGKCKMFETSKIEVIEIEEMPKEKKYKSTARFISEKEINRIQSKFNSDKLADNFLECQINTGNYNLNLAK